MYVARKNAQTCQNAQTRQKQKKNHSVPNSTILIETFYTKVQNVIVICQNKVFCCYQP